MDMCYDGALVMPSSYAAMDAEEMMYVEAGKKITLTLGAVAGAIGSFTAKKLVGLGWAKFGAAIIASAKAIATAVIGSGFLAPALIFTATGVIIAGAFTIAAALISKGSITINI